MAGDMLLDKILDTQNLTYNDIRIQFHTGKFVRDFSSQDKKAGKYRSGMMTQIGDIEENQWYQAAEEIIKEKGDWALFEKLKNWYINKCSWLRNKKEAHRYALECFVSGIHNNPEWCDYIDFYK